MTRYKALLAFVAITTTLFTATYAQAPQQLTMQVNKPGAPIQPTMWGVFFEDINFAADGGLYAELVKNRSFEFDQPRMGWEEVKQDSARGSILIINRQEDHPNNPRYARITVQAPAGAYGLVNEGFRGMGIEKGKQYHFSMLAAAPAGARLKARLVLLDEKGQNIGEAALSGFSSSWQQHKAVLTATAT